MNSTGEEIEELANQLEVFYEDVAIKDENGYVVDIDFDKRGIRIASWC